MYHVLLQIGKLVQTLSTQLDAKGKEMSSFREKHGLLIKDDADKSDKKAEDSKATTSGSGGVLVDNSASS